MSKFILLGFVSLVGLALIFGISAYLEKGYREAVRDVNNGDD